MSAYNAYHNETDGRSTSDSDKANGDNHLEVIRTISRVPGNPNYYEKNGLRTEGDGYDHTAENKVIYVSSTNTAMMVR